MWGERQRITAEATTTQVLEGDDKHWKLVTVHENRHSGLAPAFCVTFLRSPVYHVIIIFVTLINALVTIFSPPYLPTCTYMKLICVHGSRVTR
jgi:hypothetical protein